MLKTFYAIEATIYKVEADVNHHNVSIDPTRTQRTELESFYFGALGTRQNALACMEGLKLLIDSLGAEPVSA